MRIRAACAGMDRENRVAAIVGTGERELELEVGELLAPGRQVAGDVRDDLVVLFAACQLEQALSFIELLVQRGPGGELNSEIGELLQEGLGGGLVVPEVRIS